MNPSRDQWAISFLKWIDAPVTWRNRRAVVAWVSAEGTQARFNPLATTQPMPGSWDFNAVGVQNYITWEQGLDATLKTLGYKNLGYEAILKRLRGNRRPFWTLRAVEKSAWGTGGLALRVLKSLNRDYWSYAGQRIG